MLHQPVWLAQLAGAVVASEHRTEARAADADNFAEVDLGLTPVVLTKQGLLLSPAEQQYLGRFKKLKAILSGELSISLYLEFMYSANKADLQILKNIKSSIEVKLVTSPTQPQEDCHCAVLYNVRSLTAWSCALQARNSVCHSATIFANAIMHSGTTVDAFLRENLDWLSRATNWAKFSATAGLGVIHRGHLAQASTSS